MKNKTLLIILLLFPLITLVLWVTWGILHSPTLKPGVIENATPTNSITPTNQTTNKVEKTVEDRLAEYGPSARARMQSYFEAKQVKYPPARLTLVGLKDEKTLEIYAAGANQELKFIRSYPILAASGVAGPKLKQGDRQVPEGIYPVEWLNPNSSYHLSFRVGYPNAFDRQHAQEEGRTNLGGDIMIHGDAKSVGCLAMGDPASEELFVLAAQTGITNMTVILTPVDFRKAKTVSITESMPKWTPELYELIKSELGRLPVVN
jgi:murein L,D-transpeptidase YafK